MKKGLRWLLLLGSLVLLAWLLAGRPGTQPGTEGDPRTAESVPPSQPAASEAATAGSPVQSAGVVGGSSQASSLPEAPGEEGRRIVVRPPKVLAAEDAAFLKALKPRRVPAKESLHIPEGRQLRLSVKLADPFAARADEKGRLVIHADQPGAARPLLNLANARELQFRRVHTVSDEKIASLTRRAAERTGTAQADLAAVVEVRLPEADRDRVVALAQEMNAMPEVEWVELESLDQPPPPPAADIAPTTPLLVSNQGYRSAATGVDVDYVWNTFGIRGDPRVRVTDCEYDFDPDHEDLAGQAQFQANVVSRYTLHRRHGTSVMGILAAASNEYGISGSAPECSFFFYPEFSQLTTGHQSRTACVTAAIADSDEGDIVVLEMQADGPVTGNEDYVPAEYTLGVWNAVRTGTNAGVLMIAAAGNGDQNLDDSSLFAAYAARGDSGAIIVGAGTSARGRQYFSTYGSRVNLQGWGSGVFTTDSADSGTYVYGKDAKQSYTASFSGTSSATPIVTSAAMLLQSVAYQMFDRPLTPEQIRDLLVNTGRSQTGANAATVPIGPLPNLRAAVEFLLAEDSDADGYPNLMEYVLGTNPNGNPAEDLARQPKVTLNRVSGGSQMVLEFNQPANRTAVAWVAQKSATLQPGSWRDLVHGDGGTVISRVGDKVRITLPAAAVRERSFVRVEARLFPEDS